MRSRLMRVLAGAEEHLAAVLLALLLLAMIVQVFTRYVLNDPTAWTEEAARYLYVYVVFLGTSAAISSRGHVSVNVVVERLPRLLQLVLATVVHVLMIAFLVIIGWWGWKATVRNLDIPLAVTQLPYAWVYIVVPVTAVSMILRTLWLIGDDVRRYRRAQDLAPEGRAIL